MVKAAEIAQRLEELKLYHARLTLCNAPETVKARNQWDIAVLEELLAYRQKEGK